MMPYMANTERRILGYSALLSRTVVSTIQFQYHTRQLGKYFLGIVDSYGLTAQDISKTLYEVCNVYIITDKKKKFTVVSY